MAVFCGGAFGGEVVGGVKGGAWQRWKLGFMGVDGRVRRVLRGGGRVRGGRAGGFIGSDSVAVEDIFMGFGADAFGGGVD